VHHILHHPGLAGINCKVRTYLENRLAPWNKYVEKVNSLHVSSDDDGYWCPLEQDVKKLNLGIR